MQDEVPLYEVATKYRDKTIAVPFPAKLGGFSIIVYSVLENTCVYVIVTNSRRRLINMRKVMVRPCNLKILEPHPNSEKAMTERARNGILRSWRDKKRMNGS
jgi:hypothetical protein